MGDAEFKKIIWNFYRERGRDLPWRRTVTPYRVFVSEVMLQQTQASRVVPKYREFLKLFPNVASLARAKTSSVLKAWQGLGYNRRALQLKRAAEIITSRYGGRVPSNLERLIELPGIGVHTAGAILAYAFNRPVSYVETNIRRIYLHHFFPRSKNVPDRRILPLVEQTLDRKRPREWYWALMDYGAQLPKVVANPNRRSRHYVRQAKFEGSTRQLRGRVLRLVLGGARSIAQIKKETADSRTGLAIASLVKEGFLRLWQGKVYPGK